MVMFGKDELAVESGCYGSTLSFVNIFEMPQTDYYNIFGDLEAMTYLTNEEAFAFRVDEMETFQVFMY